MMHASERSSERHAGRRHAFLLPLICTLVLCSFQAGWSWFGGASGSALAAPPRQKLTVTVGQSITYPMPNVTIRSVSIADTKIADVVVANPHEILVNGKAIGFTSLVVWDENRSSTFDVVVRGPFSNEQIELSVQVAEVNRSKALETGFDFLAGDEGRTAGLFPGEVATPEIPLRIFTGAPVSGTTLALRYFKKGDDIQAMIRLEEDRGVLHLLARPRLVASSGQQASFLSGGQIPVPIATAGTVGGSTVSIEWKEFGVGIDFLPTIVDSGVINLKISPQVSSLDYSSGVVLSGFSIPGIRTRRADTSVELKDGESLVIGGLINEEETRSVRRVPILGRIPLLGFFFSHTRKDLTNSELLFIVTARIVHALPQGATVKLPEIGQAGE